MDNITKLEDLLAKQRAIASDLRLMKGDYILANGGERLYDLLEEAEDNADRAARDMSDVMTLLRAGDVA